MKFISVAIILLGLLYSTTEAQAFFLVSINDFVTTATNPESTFKEIETGIKTANPGKITKYLTENSYLSLPNGVAGYFSSSQSFYILKDFFKSFVPLSFNFRKRVNAQQPVATGPLVYESKGKRENATVYVELSYEGNTWRIVQFMVN
ncbi:MAG: DUF4783 domain-containing protein [Ignavibacteriales bacterium]|nr:MAG: DUF4783 domain-containing protein [Ignavibacteriaceae bacterium]MBW7872536.1 DUF4783 domain-containing protein [Ignavibacteria bacterium]MCZ2141911.1 DUF4783 domain-containing protein [Ignavibacteriales bacterium]MBV6445078.1 hypothetical protein [Ignavibacteriaceae bacterium]MBZ0196627.1 DUF4783 domain-containing protein [Ignavibacteriaceae bacterium]